MASLNTEIKLKKPEKYPSKRSINLLIREKHTKQNLRALALFAVYLVLLFFFTRYGVLDQLAKINQLQSDYNAMDEQLQQITAMNADYEKVRAEYSHYGNGYLNDAEKAEQDRMKILDIIERNLFDKDALQTISITDNVATLTINSEKLANVSDIVAKLEAEDSVSYVIVSTAQGSQTAQARTEAEEDGESAADAARNVNSTMTIYFKDANVEEEAAEGGTEDTAGAADLPEGSTEETAASQEDSDGNADAGAAAAEDTDAE